MKERRIEIGGRTFTALNDYGQEVKIIPSEIFSCSRAKGPSSAHGLVIIGTVEGGTISAKNKIIIKGENKTATDYIGSIEINKQRILVAIPGETIGVSLKQTRSGELLAI